MTPFKCKLCGGDIVAEAGQAHGKCDSCGTATTLPRASDEQKINLFNRANHFRRKGDFDQAVSVYENILNMDGADPEAHWGLVLSKYGIEYVEDPATHSLVPTCHRVQNESILSDLDYLAALENAPDSYTRGLYEEEAKRVSEIQKRILAISLKEEPYDVFICYKETTDGGSRSKDSALAQDVYYRLAGENYNVFFSRITLEDKLGQEYEPYIFAALNSAKVMLVIGTKPEHFNAVWVKNEWRRFLALMKKDKSRLLIPCYQDMDAHELPDELSMLQSQDMSKIGAVHDLIRGVKRVLSDKGGSATTAASGTASSVFYEANAIIDRAFIVLEDKEWQKADDLLERALNIEPRNARAYIGKLLVKLEISSEDALPTKASESNIESLAEYKDYEKALRFADSEYRAVLEGYERDRRQAVLERQYQKAVAEIKQVWDEGAFNRLASTFVSLSGYKDSSALAEKCRENALEIQYQKSVSALNSANTLEEFEWIAKLFTSLSNYKDSNALVEKCRENVLELKYQEAVSCMSSAYASNVRDADTFKQLAEKFVSLSGYKDSDILAKNCIDEAERIDEYLLRITPEMLKSGEKLSRASKIIGWISIFLFPCEYIIVAIFKYNSFMGSILYVAIALVVTFIGWLLAGQGINKFNAAKLPDNKANFGMASNTIMTIIYFISIIARLIIHC